jgi:hypothetical protein
MEEVTKIEYDDPRDEIGRLEERIEELAAKIENCRKFIYASRVAVGLGGFLLMVWVFGVVPFGPEVLTTAIVAALGGIVLMGSSRSTGNEAAEQLAAVEARRAALIGQIDFRVVGDRDGANVR